MKKEKVVGLVQINNSFSGQNFFPYSVGILQSYAQKYLQRPKEYEFLPQIFNRMPVQNAVKLLLGADVAFFSLYVWNQKISLEIAKNLRVRNPNVIIVFGGPQVPNRSDDFMRKHEFIDMVCHGEGETTFTAILENINGKNWNIAPSISYRKSDGTIGTNKRTERIQKLSSIPSPYLSGVFDEIMKANPNEQWIGLWETNRGCPFTCAYCDWGSSIHNQMFMYDIERLHNEVEWFAEHKIKFILCADSNFGIIPRDIDLARYVAKIKEVRGYPHALSVQTTKNATEQSYIVGKILSDAGLNKGISLSLQSVDPTTLHNINRSNISTETFQELQHRFTRDRVDTFTDLILGLPGETYDSYTRGVSKVIADGQHNRIQFHNLSILPNAQMGDPEYQKKFGMQTVTNNIVNIHGSINTSKDDIMETQDLVIATNSMPKKDWVRARVFAWTTGLLHFNKIFQIPLIILHEKYGLDYKEIIEQCIQNDEKNYPVLSRITKFFIEKAQRIQKGEEEFCQSKEWLTMWWPADELMHITICAENILNNFYSEAKARIFYYLNEKSIVFDKRMLHEAIELNKSLMKLPFQKNDQEITLSYNLWESYRSILAGEHIQIEKKTMKYVIDKTTKIWNSWEDWAREVIWWENKKGAYMYKIKLT